MIKFDTPLKNKTTAEPSACFLRVWTGVLCRGAVRTGPSGPAVSAPCPRVPRAQEEKKHTVRGRGGGPVNTAGGSVVAHAISQQCSPRLALPPGVLERGPPAAPRTCSEAHAWSVCPPSAPRRSYLTPVRDEEAESLRRARSRQARQARRATQVSVTLPGPLAVCLSIGGAVRTRNEGLVPATKWDVLSWDPS